MHTIVYTHLAICTLVHHMSSLGPTRTLKYVEDISRIHVTECEMFEDPSDNCWMLQTMMKEIMDEHAPIKTMNVRAKETPFMNADLRRS